MSREAFLQIYHKLFEQHGPQYWWPANSAFEVMVGAILVQNTSWSNVEKVLASLEQDNLIDPECLLSLSVESIASRIHSAGYFNVKAKRLYNYCQWYINAGGYVALDRLDTDVLREELLGVNGVGPETADDILLYAFHRPVFVIDAYTRRLFSRLALLDCDLSYESMQLQFELLLGKNVELFNEFHALIDVHAAKICKKKPVCEQCNLSRLCKYDDLSHHKD